MSDNKKITLVKLAIPAVIFAGAFLIDRIMSTSIKNLICKP